MSADNGIYVACFPNGTFRVAHAFASVVDELESHFYTPEMYKVAVGDIWGKSYSYNSRELAMMEADNQLSEVNYTEYGICSIRMPVNFGEMKEPTPEPELPEGACPHCSTPGSHTVMHGVGDRGCHDPELPHNWIRLAIRQRAIGVNDGMITNIVLDAIAENRYMIVKADRLVNIEEG